MDDGAATTGDDGSALGGPPPPCPPPLPDATLAPDPAAHAVATAPPDIFAPPLAVTPGPTRALQVYAFDPSLGGRAGNEMTLTVGWEKLLPGPIGDRFAVVDYDGGTKGYYVPVDLDDPALLARDGFSPSESDPRFHQQMVYAVATETVERFEAALGRRIHWQRVAHRPPPGTPNRLYLFPHAMRQANAFYSREAHGILFGYFSAPADARGQLLPGQTVFTCLSHDIIAHEVTHAIVDGIRGHFMEATNPDVAAFHEAFADLAALFQHFAHQDVLRDAIERTGGRLLTARLRPAGGGDAAGDPLGAGGAQIRAEAADDNPLIQLARQFGQTGGSSNGLRSAIGGVPDATELGRVGEPHARGAILVAAVFDAFFSVYLRRAAALFRVFRAGGGAAEPVDLPAPLADLLAERASKTAGMFFGICARALDYLPPVDVTFGDFLRALITADRDLYPVDSAGVRDALMQAFRVRGIVPDDAAYFSETSLCWPTVTEGALPTVDGLEFGDPNGLTTPEKNVNGDVLRAYGKVNAAALGFDLDDGPIAAETFHPMFRTAQDGSLKIDMVVELTQSRAIERVPGTPGFGTVTIRNGVTLIIAKPALQVGQRAGPRVRFAIAKRPSQARAARTRAAVAGGDGERIDFALLHGLDR